MIFPKNDYSFAFLVIFLVNQKITIIGNYTESSLVYKLHLRDISGDEWQPVPNLDLRIWFWRSTHHLSYRVWLRKEEYACEILSIDINQSYQVRENLNWDNIKVLFYVYWAEAIYSFQMEWSGCANCQMISNTQLW